MVLSAETKQPQKKKKMRKEAVTGSFFAQQGKTMVFWPKDRNSMRSLWDFVCSPRRRNGGNPENHKSENGVGGKVAVGGHAGPFSEFIFLFFFFAKKEFLERNKKKRIAQKASRAARARKPQHEQARSETSLAPSLLAHVCSHTHKHPLSWPCSPFCSWVTKKKKKVKQLSRGSRQGTGHLWESNLGKIINSVANYSYSIPPNEQTNKQ